MTFDEFQNKARLHAVGALEPEEFEAFEEARKHFGQSAENYLVECSNLGAAFALSLYPHPPPESARERLMTLIRAATCGRRQSNG